MKYQFDFKVILEAWPDLLRGCWLTLSMSAISMVFGLAIGLLCVVFRQSGSRIARFLVNAFVETIRNTPFLVQVFFLFFGLPALGIRLSAGFAAVLALSLNGGAFATEIIRGGVEAINKGQIEAGYALGLKRLQIFRDIVMRPALRAIYPALTGQFILLLLTSSIVSSVSAEELTYVAQRLESVTFRSFEVYLIATLLYLMMSVLLGVLFKAIGRIYFSYPTA
jgi:polar amino acid transport system permease protein